MLLDASTQRNLLAVLGARRTCKLELCAVAPDAHDLCAGGGRTNVYHEHFALGELADLGLLAVAGLNAEEAAKEEVVYFKVGVNGGKLSTEAEDEADETIGTAERRVNTSTNT